jgi:hypothetical protein
MDTTTSADGVVFRVSQQPFSYDIRWFYRNPLSNFFDHSYASGTVGGYFPGGFTDPLSKVSVTQADNRAKAQYLSSIRALRTTFQGGVALGEMAETVRMITNPLSSLRKGVASYLSVLKKRRSGFQRRPLKRRLHDANKMIADTWLEYSFGWKPLILDIRDAAKELVLLQSKASVSGSPVSGFGQATFRLPTTTGSLGVSMVGADIFSNTRATFGVSVKYTGWVGGEGFSNRSSLDALGFTPETFVPTVWELIPYSFLIDYFSNVGDLVSSMTTSTYGLRWTCRTQLEFTESEQETSINVPKPNDPTTQVVLSPQHGKTTIRYQKWTRRSFTGSLIPSFQVEVPTRINQYVNIAALIAGGRSLEPFVH